PRDSPDFLAVPVEDERDLVACREGITVPTESERAVRQREPEKDERRVVRPRHRRKGRDRRELLGSGQQPELAVDLERTQDTAIPGRRFPRRDGASAPGHDEGQEK